MAPTTDLDPRTILCALAGEPAALARLYGRHHPLVLRIAQRTLERLGLDDAPAELAAEVWLRLLDHDRRALRTFDPRRGSFRVFVKMVAWQHALLVARRWARRLVHEAPCHPSEASEPLSPCTTATLHHRRLLGRVLDEARPQLTALDVVLLEEALLWRTPAHELAQRLNLPTSAVYKRNQRLRARLCATARRLEAEPRRHAA